MAAIALEHKDTILARIAAGEPLTSIALSLGYSSHSGIIERLGDDPDYQAAMRSGIVGKIEKRESELEVADSNVTVTRADRLLGHARWWAEKLDRQRFGKEEVGALAITLNVVQFTQSVYDNQTVPSTGIMSNRSSTNSVVAAQRAERLAVDAELVDNPDGTLVPTLSPVPPGLVDSGGE